MVRCDQLVNYIKAADEASRKRKYPKDSFAGMERNGRGWLARSKPVQVDLAGRYAIAEAQGKSDGEEGAAPKQPADVARETVGSVAPATGKPSPRRPSVPCAVAPWC